MNGKKNNSEIPKRSPPVRWEGLLASFLRPEDKEVILGDFAEEHARQCAEIGWRQADRWYRGQVLASIVPLQILRLTHHLRSFTMNRNQVSALLGLALSLPALLLVVGGLAQSGLQATALNDALNFQSVLFHPALILGGLALAVTINTIPLVQFRYHEGVLTGSLSIKGRLLNWAMLAAISLAASVIFLYLLAENLQIFSGL